jgi:hypothetical protein
MTPLSQTKAWVALSPSKLLPTTSLTLPPFHSSDMVISPQESGPLHSGTTTLQLFRQAPFKRQALNILRGQSPPLSQDKAR